MAGFTNTKEKGLEALFVRWLVEYNGYEKGNNADYSREYAIDEDGNTKHKPFHVYTMKWAIQEGFILDVFQNYTPTNSFYKLMKTVEDDPMFDKKRASKKLHNFVESDSYTHGAMQQFPEFPVPAGLAFPAVQWQKHNHILL